MSEQNSKSITLLITAWNEPISVARSVQTVIKNKLDIEIVVVAPDDKTQNAAKEVFDFNNYTKFKILTDPQSGKPNAINLSLEQISSDWIICTDGDIVLYPDSISTLIYEIQKIGANYGAISARPISIDSRDNFWGYIGHLLADSAHVKRSQARNYFVSGYLCAYDKSKIKPLPASTLVDDAQFSIQILEQKLDIKYTPESTVGVKYPTNLTDWLTQKRRSAGGYRELRDQIKGLNLQSTQRTFWNELSFIFYPLQYTSNIRELFYSLGLYPLRLLLWILILKDSIIKPNKLWERVESTKIVK
jgi:cellulose synthase/poly-beta-1,6-N-acetylglucosamine synthase-like glycosyltransferase